MDRKNYYNLIAKLQSEIPQDREAALNNLNSYGYEIVGPVTRRLFDAESSIRKKASKILEEKNLKVEVQAVLNLYVSGYKARKRLVIIMHKLLSNTKNISKIHFAVIVITFVGLRELFEEVAILAITHENKYVRRAAIEGLYNYNENNLIDVFLLASVDEDYMVRKYAVVALAENNITTQSHRLCNDENNQVKETAIEAFKSCGNKILIENKYRKTMKNSNLYKLPEIGSFYPNRKRMYKLKKIAQKYLNDKNQVKVFAAVDVLWRFEDKIDCINNNNALLVKNYVDLLDKYKQLPKQKSDKDALKYRNSLMELLKSLGWKFEFKHDVRILFYETQLIVKNNSGIAYVWKETSYNSEYGENLLIKKALCELENGINIEHISNYKKIRNKNYLIDYLNELVNIDLNEEKRLKFLKCCGGLGIDCILQGKVSEGLDKMIKSSLRLNLLSINVCKLYNDIFNRFNKRSLLIDNTEFDITYVINILLQFIEIENLNLENDVQNHYGKEFIYYLKYNYNYDKNNFILINDLKLDRLFTMFYKKLNSLLNSKKYIEYKKQVAYCCYNLVNMMEVSLIPLKYVDAEAKNNREFSKHTGIIIQKLEGYLIDLEVRGIPLNNDVDLKNCIDIVKELRKGFYEENIKMKILSKNISHYKKVCILTENKSMKETIHNFFDLQSKKSLIYIEKPDKMQFDKEKYDLVIMTEVPNKESIKVFDAIKSNKKLMIYKHEEKFVRYLIYLNMLNCNVNKLNTDKNNYKNKKILINDEYLEIRELIDLLNKDISNNIIISHYSRKQAKTVKTLFFSEGKYSFITERHKIYSINRKKEKVEIKNVNEIKLNEELIFYENNNGQDIIEEIINRLNKDIQFKKAYEPHINNVHLWKDILKDYIGKNVKNIDEISSLLRIYGTGRSSMAIDTWIEGDIIGPKDIEVFKNLAYIMKNYKFIRNYRTYYESTVKIRNLHVKIRGLIFQSIVKNQVNLARSYLDKIILGTIKEIRNYIKIVKVSKIINESKLLPINMINKIIS